MAVNNLKKINVRSPYYITVSKAEEADVDVTEPVDQESTITCGSTTQVGIDVGTRIFKISTEGRQLGDYTITFAGIKTPIKYRIGHSANMPSYATVGLDIYSAEWTAATGESPTLTSPTYDASGVVGTTATATYTSTQGDIDLYGEEIQLEIQQPLITEDYSFSLSCPDLAADETPVSAGKVVIVSLINNLRSATGHQWSNITLNGENLTEFTNIYPNQTQRYVLSDASPAIEPEDDNTYNPSSPTETRVTGNNFFNQNQFGKDLRYFRYISTSPTYYEGRVKAKHVSPSPLSSGFNDLVITNDSPYGVNLGTAQMTVLISRHDVELKNGVYYIRGSQDGNSAEALQVSFSLAPSEVIEIGFIGSSSTPLEKRLAVKTISSNAGTTDWDEGAAGLGDETQIIEISEFTINPV